METLYQLSIALTTWLQASYPQLHGFMSAVSAMGEEEFFLVVLPAIYWSIDKRLGRQLGYFFLLSALINNILKNLIRQPRPFWLEPAVKRNDVEGYGMPSGHVQNATVVFMLVAAHFRRAWVWLVVLMYILVMAISRIYLGVHFIQDTVTGFLAGLVILGLFVVWQIKLLSRFNRQILGRRLLVILFAPLILAVVYISGLLIIGAPNMNVPWASFVPAAELDGYKVIVSSLAGLFGFGIGIIMESSRIRFRADGPAWQRVARYLLGIVVALGIWAGLRAVFPTEPLWLALPFRFLRYLLLLSWVTYFAPWVFVRLRVAQVDAESEIQVTFP